MAEPRILSPPERQSVTQSTPIEPLALVRLLALSLILLSLTLRSPFWNPAALPLPEPCLSVPLSLWNWFRLWLFTVYLLRFDFDL